LEHKKRKEKKKNFYEDDMSPWVLSRIHIQQYQLSRTLQYVCICWIFAATSVQLVHIESVK
jgi:hypothetical protein